MDHMESSASDSVNSIGTMIFLPILTAVLGTAFGAWLSHGLRKRRRRRKALEEMEITLSKIQRYCWDINAALISSDPRGFPDEELKMTEDEAEKVVARTRKSVDNLDRHAFEATRILRKHPSLPYKSEIIEALYSEEFPTIEDRAWQIAELRGKIHDEIESYWFDKGGQTLKQLDEHQPGGHVSTEDIHNASSPPSPSLTETGLRCYIHTVRFSLGEILEKQKNDN